jgi:dipeptidyl aminopeptidase/acylaminoacyl peptidase
MFSRPVDGSGGEVQLGTSERPRFAGPWSPDGKLLAFVEYDPTTLNDIYLLSGAEPDKPWVFLKTPYSEVEPVFSPDSKWIAYVSYESGHREVYVRPVSGAGPKWRVSTHGGAELRWPRHSQELFYREGKKMMAVKIQTSPSFKLGIPHPLFEGDYETSASIHSAMYDVTPDGQKFLMIKNDEAENSTRKLRIVLNWFDELKGKVPAR